jgi:hypothetical protein
MADSKHVASPGGMLEDLDISGLVSWAVVVLNCKRVVENGDWLTLQAAHVKD